MAKLMVELDTETDGVTVMVDGVKIEHVNYVSVNNYGCYYDYNAVQDRFHFSVTTTEKVGDVTKQTSLCASKVESSKASEKYPGLFETIVESEKLKTAAGFEISQFFSKGRKVKS